MISASSGVKVNKDAGKARGKSSNQVHPHPLDRSFYEQYFNNFKLMLKDELKFLFTNDNHVCMERNR